MTSQFPPADHSSAANTTPESPRKTAIIGPPQSRQKRLIPGQEQYCSWNAPEEYDKSDLSDSPCRPFECRERKFRITMEELRQRRGRTGQASYEVCSFFANHATCSKKSMLSKISGPPPGGRRPTDFFTDLLLLYYYYYFLLVLTGV